MHKTKGHPSSQTAEAPSKLLEAVSRPEFLLNGFRNRDLRPLRFGAAEVSPAEQRRQAAKISRLLRMLRAHGLILRVAKTFRDQLTARGRTNLAALQAARTTTPAQLAKPAGCPQTFAARKEPQRYY